jgi:hypothetical protein
MNSFLCAHYFHIFSMSSFSMPLQQYLENYFETNSRPKILKYLYIKGKKT